MIKHWPAPLEYQLNIDHLDKVIMKDGKKIDTGGRGQTTRRTKTRDDGLIYVTDARRDSDGEVARHSKVVDRKNPVTMMVTKVSPKKRITIISW